MLILLVGFCRTPSIRIFHDAWPPLSVHFKSVVFCVMLWMSSSSVFRFLWLVQSWLPLRVSFSLVFICPSGLLIYFPLHFVYANVGVSLDIPLLFSLILFKNLQFECIPHPILTGKQKCMWTKIHKYWRLCQYNILGVIYRFIICPFSTKCHRVYDILSSANQHDKLEIKFKKFTLYCTGLLIKLCYVMLN